MTFRMNDDDLFWCAERGPYFTDIGGNAACVECGKIKEPEMDDAKVNKHLLGINKTDSEILDEIYRFIPVNMQSDFNLCLLQSYFAGHAAGVHLERQACIDVLRKCEADALARLMREETE